MLKCHKTREDYFRFGTEISQEIFLMEWKNYKKVLQEEKRKLINNILQNVKEARSQGRVRSFFYNDKAI